MLTLIVILHYATSNYGYICDYSIGIYLRRNIFLFGLWQPEIYTVLCAKSNDDTGNM